MDKNVSNFISKLEKLNDERVEVFIPSRNKTVTVKPLNIKQQKDLIACSLDGIRGAFNYNKTINKIILDNSGIPDLKIYDKLPFCITLRTQSLGPEMMDSEDNVIDLEKTLYNVKNIPFKLKDKATITYENLKVSLEVPTLQEENILISKCDQLFDSRDMSTSQHKDGVSILYLFEIVKYIKKLEIDDEAVDMSEIRVKERIDLVERLPLAIYTDLTEFVSKLNSYDQKVLTTDGVIVPIDSAFFDSSISR
tara:strand:- start:245 stop:997 length:753 start_codon:yes stop_codon:yes gene_type:complete